jgi:FkbM family methyltransferase
VKRTVGTVLSPVIWRARRRFESDPHKRRVLDWFIENPREEVRYNYPLTASSVVLDLGGYRGDWTREIVRRYSPYVHVFEPVPEFALAIAAEFGSNPKVRVHQFGLLDCDGEQQITQSADASSMYIESGTLLSAQFRDVAAFFQEAELKDVALMKLNIEGGEYPLLERMIQAELVSRCADIQVQFHDFVPQAASRRAAIREVLATTHRLTYDYPFVWENWERRRPADHLPFGAKAAQGEQGRFEDTQ